MLNLYTIEIISSVIGLSRNLTHHLKEREMCLQLHCTSIAFCIGRELVRTGELDYNKIHSFVELWKDRMRIEL